MYDQLKSRVADLIARPRPLKPQTERQLAEHLAEHTASLRSFLLAAAEVLEDYELDILFGPQFTPTIDELAEVADLLYHWRPSDDELTQLVNELTDDVGTATVLLPDGDEADLTLHEAMVDRYVRLLRLSSAPDAATAASLRDSLPAELWPVAVALACQRGFDSRKQKWFADFVHHQSEQRAIVRGLLETVADFIAKQPSLDRPALIEAADALVRASQETAAFASSGHTYWSADVAQHHHYRGQGNVDKHRLEQRRKELEWATAMAEDLRSFDLNVS